MTEDEWLMSTDPMPMLEFLNGETTDRKLRLFAVACCRRIFDLLVYENIKSAVVLAEAMADGLAAEDERADAAYHLDAGATAVEAAVYSAISLKGNPAAGAAYAARSAVAAANAGADWGDVDDAPPTEVVAQLRFANDIFGNPFRPVTFTPAWRTSDVMLLANGIYDERAFDRMPILADALQDAGCDNDDILNHLRDPQAAHVRGCWALDLVLGKE